MKRKHLTLGFMALFVDLLAFNCIHLYLLRNSSETALLQPFYMAFFVFSNMAWLLSFYTSGDYIFKKSKKLNRLVKATFFSYALLLTLNLLFFNADRLSDTYIFNDMALCGCYLLISRVAVTCIVKLIDLKGLFKKKVVIIGCNELSVRLISQLDKKEFTYQIDGLFSDDPGNHHKISYPILGTIEECVSYAIRNQVQEIYAVLPPEDDERLYRIGAEAEQNFIRFKIVPDLNKYLKRGHHFEPDQELTIMSMRPEPLAEDLGGQLQKRVFDVVFSLLVIIFVLSWLTPLLAFLIKLDSPGPVFFKQFRTGRKNRPFLCFKFRSLEVNRDADTKQVTKDDTRFTRLGKFLRKTSIDELPQFFNVLSGDMSIVGSRPHMIKHTETYSRLHKKYMLRHTIKPGLTGWAQVNGYRGEIQVDDQLIKRVDHDLWYIENWNFWLDMRIVIQTVSGSFKANKNAY